MSSKQIDFLYLSEEDIKVAGVLNMKRCVEVIDEMFQLMGSGDYLMGGPKQNDHGLMIWFPEEQLGPRMPVTGPDRRFLSLISYLGGRFHVCGNKWYGSNIENAQIGLPRSVLTITLNDPDTSAPLAFMSGNLVSAMRTGAVPGVAAKYLANREASIVGLVGAGVINRACMLAICETMPQIKEVVIFDLNKEKAAVLAQEIKDLYGVQGIVADNIKECVEGADIISVATSGHIKPQIKDEWLKKGALLALTGAAELSDETYKKHRVVVDNWKMHKAWLRDAKEHPDGIKSIVDWAMTGQLLKLVNEGNFDSGQVTDLGEVALNQKCRSNINDNQETTIFLTGGLPIEDLAWGYEIYQNALKQGIGQKLNLWQEPHWS